MIDNGTVDTTQHAVQSIIQYVTNTRSGVGNVFFPVCQFVKFNVKIYVCVPMKNCVI